MTITVDTVKDIRKIISQLEPQAVTAQLDKTLEFSEAEARFNLQVTGLTYVIGMYKIVVYEGDKGPYYETLWANNGRPYIRLYDSASNELVDIFLLPPA